LQIFIYKSSKDKEINDFIIYAPIRTNIMVSC